MNQLLSLFLKSIIGVLFAVALLAQILNAQQTPPKIEWQKSLGGLGHDVPTSIVQTADGGYIVAGWSSSIDGDVSGHHGLDRSVDYWVVKITSAGAIQWQKSLGGSGDDLATSIVQISDGGYIVAGWSESTDGDVTGNHGMSDCWIVKLTSAGGIEWQKSLGGSRRDYAHSIQQTSDGGYIVAGHSSSTDGDVTAGHHGSIDSTDTWIVKLTSTGGIEWQTLFGGSGTDGATSIAQTNDGGYIVAGWSLSNDGDVTGHHGSAGYSDYWIVKLSSTGGIEWQKSLGGSGDDLATSILQTTDGGYIVTGRSLSNDGDVIGNHGAFDSWIVKLTSAGVIEWQQSLGGSNFDGGNSIKQTTDGGYIVAGYSQSNDGDVRGNHGSADYWIIKLTSAGVIEWQRLLGGRHDDRATFIQQVSDGGYIIVGAGCSYDGDATRNHGSAGLSDFWIVKFAPIIIQGPSPAIEWQKSLGGSGFDAAYSIAQTSDGGYIAAGYSESNDGDASENHGFTDYWIVKLTSRGAMEWQKSLGGSNREISRSIVQMSDGGYIVAGGSSSTDGDVSGNHGGYDFWIVKLTSEGELVWQKSLGGSDWDEANYIQQTSDGGYIVAGYSYSTNGDVSGHHGLADSSDAWVVKLTGGGAIEWQKSLGGSGVDVAYSITQTREGGYIVAGASRLNDGDVRGNHGGYDYWIVKLTSAGGIEWQKSLGGSGLDYARSIKQDNDGGYIVAGYSYSTDGDVSGNYGGSVAWIVKLTSGGELVWLRSLGGSSWDETYSMAQTADSGYIVAGLSSSHDGDVTGNHGGYDYWVMKLTSGGNFVWQKSLGGRGNDYAHSIAQTSDGGYIVAGLSHSSDSNVTGHHGPNGYPDVWIVKLASSNPTGVKPTDLSTPSPWAMNANYPNPFSTTTTITFTVPERSFVRLSVDTEQGVEVARLIEEQLEAGEYRVPFSGDGLASGTYLYRLSSGSTSLVGKMTVVR